MAINFFFDKQLVISRLRSAGGNKKSFQTTATVDGAVQHGDPQANTETGLVSDIRWEGYAAIDSGIQQGDLVTVTIVGSERRFKVMEVHPVDYGSATNQHLELVLAESK